MQKVISTDKAPSAIGPYSQAIEINGMVYTSGVIPVIPATGEIDESEIRHHPDRNRLLRAVGMHDQTGILNSVQTIEKNENRHQFLLCSDGFWEYIDEKHMEKTLKRAKTPEIWLAKMQKIVQKNGKNNNMDNYTAIAVFLD